MRAYRTKLPYYFSSKRLLARGAVVFYAEKIKHYVHPQDGILFDQHPRLHVLSEEESQELESQWHKQLSHYE